MSEDCIPGYHHGCGASDRGQVYYGKIELDEDSDESRQDSLVKYVLFWCFIIVCIGIVTAIKKAVTEHNEPVQVMNRRGETFEQFLDRQHIEPWEREHIRRFENDADLGI